MNIYADKTQEIKSRFIASESSKSHCGDNSTFQFVDSRPKAIAQRKLQNIADNRSRVMRTAPDKETIQRVELEDRVDKSDGWTRIVDNTGDWMALIENQVVVMLVPKSDFDSANVNAINDMPPKYKEKGCAVCVAADFLGTSARGLASKMSKLPQPVQKAFAQIYTDNGYSNLVETLYTGLKIYVASERFNNYQEMTEVLIEDSLTWSGALAWEGHIIRASGNGNSFRFWDPQTGLDPASVPLNTPLILITFST